MAGHILLAGYLGAGNLGDDAVMLGFVHGLGSLGYDVSVMSGSPEETYRLYGFHSIQRRDMKAFEEILPKVDALVFPGGSIFQDVTSVKSAMYYSQLVKKAKSAGKKVILVGQGVGPLNSFLGKRAAAAAFNAADAIAVRDPASLQTLKNIGVSRNVRVTADSAYLMPPPTTADDAPEFAVGQMKSVGISARPIKDRKVDVASLFADFCRMLYQSGSMPVLIEMDRNEDGPLILEISKRQGGKVPDLRKVTTPMQLQGRLARMDALVAMRLHAGILAATVGIPPVMIGYDPKVNAFAHSLDVGAALPLDGLSAGRMLEAFLQSQKDRDRNAKIVTRKLEELVKAAEGNIELTRDTMESTVRR